MTSFSVASGPIFFGDAPGAGFENPLFGEQADPFAANHEQDHNQQEVFQAAEYDTYGGSQAQENAPQGVDQFQPAANQWQTTEPSYGGEQQQLQQTAVAEHQSQDVSSEFPQMSPELRDWSSMHPAITPPASSAAAEPTSYAVAPAGQLFKTHTPAHSGNPTTEADEWLQGQTAGDQGMYTAPTATDWAQPPPDAATSSYAFEEQLNQDQQEYVVPPQQFPLPGEPATVFPQLGGEGSDAAFFDDVDIQEEEEEGKEGQGEHQHQQQQQHEQQQQKEREEEEDYFPENLVKDNIPLHLPPSQSQHQPEPKSVPFASASPIVPPLRLPQPTHAYGEGRREFLQAENLQGENRPALQQQYVPAAAPTPPPLTEPRHQQAATQYTHHQTNDGSKVASGMSSKLASGVSSANSSHSSTPHRANPNLEAGRRKLEELRQKKAAALARKLGSNKTTAAAAAAAAAHPTSITSSSQPPVSSQIIQAQLESAQQRAAAAVNESAQLSRDLDKVLRQLESVDQERTMLQREKASLMGEVISLQSVAEAAQASYNNNAAATEEIEAARRYAESESARASQLEATLQAERAAHAERLSAVELETQEALQNSAAQADQLRQWAENIQAESEYLKTENGQLRAQLESVSAQDNAAAVAEQIEGLLAELAAAHEESVRLRAEVEAQRAMTEDAVASGRDDVDSLRELLGEGEAERALMQMRIAELEDALQAAEQHASNLTAEHQANSAYETAAGQAQGETADAYMEQQHHLQEAEARAAQAESQLFAAAQQAEIAKADAEAVRVELAAAHELAADLSSQVAAMERLHLDSSSLNSPATGTGTAAGGGGKNSGKFDDIQTLKLRLSKAEAAVEKERRAAQALERQLREGEATVAEGRAATASAFELRRRCDAAEREASILSARAAQLESAAAALPDAHARALHGLQAAEQRAAGAETAAMDLRAQCDAAARTISKLMEENLELTERLNKQGDAVGQLQDALASSSAHFAASAAAAAGAAAQSVAPGVAAAAGENGQAYQPAQGPPVWDIPGAKPVEQEPQVTGDWRQAAPTSPKPKKKVGFWAWVAGADLAEGDE